MVTFGLNLFVNSARFNLGKIPKRNRVDVRQFNSLGDENLPWQIGSYYSKKKERNTDSLGRFSEESVETLQEPVHWTKEGQLQVALLSLAQEKGLDIQFVNQQVDKLMYLLPNFKNGISKTPHNAAKLILALSLRVEAVGQQIITWRLSLPSVDLNKMITTWPEMLYIPSQQIQSTIEQVRELLQNPEDFEYLVEKEPQLLDVELLTGAIEGYNRYNTQNDFTKQLRASDTFFSSVIPLEGQSRGDRDEEYLASTLKAQD